MNVISERNYCYFDNNNRNANGKVTRFELEEAMEVIIRHGESDKGNCMILNSYPLSMTLIRCCSSSDRSRIIRKLNEFSRVVKGSHWIVLEEVNNGNEYVDKGEVLTKKKGTRSNEYSTKNIVMLEFFNYNEGFFRNNIAGILNNTEEMNILHNYFSHPNSILSMNIDGTSSAGPFENEEDSGMNGSSRTGVNDVMGTGRNKASLATTLRRRRDFEIGNSRSFFGITLSNSSNYGLQVNSYKLKELDESCLAFAVRIHNIESFDVSLSELESIYNEFWLISGDKSSKKDKTNHNLLSCTGSDDIGTGTRIVSNSNGVGDSLSSQSGSFLTVLAFNVQKDGGVEDGFEDGSGGSSRDVEIYMLHIFETEKEYEFMSKTGIWNDYLLSLMRVTNARGKGTSEGTLYKNGIEMEFSIHKLIYCCNSCEYKALDMNEETLSLKSYKSESEKQDAQGRFKENASNLPPKAARTGAVMVSSCMKKSDYCLKQVSDNSNVSSSTDLDSVTTSINSSRENLTVTDSSGLKKKSMEVVIDEGNGDLSFGEEDDHVENDIGNDTGATVTGKEEKSEIGLFSATEEVKDNAFNFSFVSPDKLDGEMLVSSLSNVDFWKSSLRASENSGVCVNTGYKLPFVSNHDRSNVGAGGSSGAGSAKEEDEYYECREMKYEPRELKRILTQMSSGKNFRCSSEECVYCNNSSGYKYNNVEDGDFWCRSGFKSFCQIYKKMGVVRLTGRTNTRSSVIESSSYVNNCSDTSWLIREFIGDEVSDVVFCDGINRRRTTIEGDSRGLRVYLVGDFNDWNKTSHELALETEEIECENKRKFVDYPEVPNFMKGRVYSILLRNEDLTKNGSYLNSFKLRIVTTRRKESESLEETEESETYRLLTYSRNLIASGIRDNGNNKLLNCLLDASDEASVHGLRCPLPMCVDYGGANGVKSGEFSKEDSALILEELIRNTRLSSLYVYEANISCSNGLITGNGNRASIGSSNNLDSTQNFQVKCGTFYNFKINVLPRVSRGGYNTILFSDVLEHSRSYDYQYPCNYLVPHTEYGNLEEFKELVDECHKRGLLVLIDFNLAFGDITSANSMFQPCDREVNNSLGSNAKEVEGTVCGEKTDKSGFVDEKRALGRSSGVIEDNGGGESGVFGGSSAKDFSGIEKLFVDESTLDLYESFMLTNINTINPSFFKHTPEVISSLFAFNKNYSRLNLCYVPMLSVIISSIYYLMTELGIDGFRFTLPDLSEEGDKYPLLASILALINDVVHSVKPYGVTIANELLLRENMQERACSELSIPTEHGGIGFDFVWDVSVCSSLQDIAVKNISYSHNSAGGGFNIGRDIIERLIPFEDRMKLSGRRVLLLSKKKRRRASAETRSSDLKTRDIRDDLTEGTGAVQDAETRRNEAVELVCRTIRGIESLETKTVTQNPLRIAMFSWESLHTHLVGGVSPHVSELSASLIRLGHEVHLFTRATGSSYIIKEHDGVLYHECPFQLNSDFVTEITNMCNSFVYHMQRWEDGLTKMSDHFVSGSSQGKSSRALNAVKNGYRFNICHCHDWLAAPVLTSLRRIGNNNRTTIFTVHSTEYGRCGNQSFGGQSRRISDIEREGCHTADRIICVSGVLAEEVCRLFGINRNKIKVIYNGIHCHAFDRVAMDDPGEIKRQLGIGPLEPTFLCVARMVIQKGVDLLVEAVPGILKYRSDAKFILVGDGHQKDEIERRAHQLGVYSSIRFVGKKSGDDVVRLYKACDAVVVPSRNEPFGIVVLEGWTAGKPVVATTSGGPRDFLTPNVDGYLVEPCKDSIAWGCCEILKNFDHSRWMGSRGRVKAAYSFSWDTIARTTSYLYYEQTNTLDSAPSLVLKPNKPVMLQIFGEAALHHHMTIFDDYDKSITSLKMMKLLIVTNFAFSKNGVLQSMGSEFGNPDSFDFPRPNNNMDSSKLCCRWDLADNKGLKFKHVEFLNTALVRIERVLRWNNRGSIKRAMGGKADIYRETNCFGNESDRAELDSVSDKAGSDSGNGKSSETVSLDNISNGELDFILSSGNRHANEASDHTTKGGVDSRFGSNSPDITGSVMGLGGLIYNSLDNSTVRVLLCHESDKVLILERSVCTFVFNYSDRYYRNYGFGISSELPQSVLLDTQDERFGGNKKYVVSSEVFGVGNSGECPHNHNRCGYERNPDPDSLCGIHFVLDSVSGFSIPSEYDLGEDDDSDSSTNRILLSKGLLQRELSVFGENGGLLFGRERGLDHYLNGVNFNPLSPYRYTNTRTLKQTVFLDMSPFSAYILVPFKLVKGLSSQILDNKLVFGENIDAFVDSINRF
ncbi:hypothetical protein FG386_002088 [Cryptosporidium ryanae]|uniref:uncharacterized protein n=1 Tax=Cryptosporidium ryanae TaxID=515981 RepID=UPI00351A49BC|nr:hypothetical protein FG386_002088 [Cryptosporidium ryanae]